MVMGTCRVAYVENALDYQRVRTLWSEAAGHIFAKWFVMMNARGAAIVYGAGAASLYCGRFVLAHEVRIPAQCPEPVDEIEGWHG